MTALQQYNCANQTSGFKMSDFVVCFDLLGGRSLDEWWTKTDRMETKDKKERRHAEINERDTEEWEKSRNEVGTIKQMFWSVCCFQTWCAEKNLAIDFKSVTKMEVHQYLRQFYATLRNGKGERYEHASSNCYTTDHRLFLVSHENPVFTEQQRFCWRSEKKQKNQEGHDKTSVELMVILRQM